MSLTSLALAFALATPAAPAPAAPAVVTFTELAPIVGDSCTTTTHTSMRFEGRDAAIIAAFGTERGGDKITESTVLEVKGGAVTKERLRIVQANKYGMAGEGSERRTEGDAIEGHVYVLTRLDAAGHFAATHEDGSDLSPAEAYLLKDELDQTEPALLTGRTMKLGERLVFDRRETKKYFPFEGQTGVTMRGFEMTLGALEGKTARVDLKFLFDLQGENGDAAVKGWATTHTDLDQRNQTSALEGPLRIALARPAGGLGAGIDAKVDAPYELKGTFDLTSQLVCAPRR